MTSWKDKAEKLKTGVHVLYHALKDPRTPWYVKAFAAAVIAYALSPIDLIPDFIPVLGYLDDLVIVPAGIYLTLKMVPAPLREEFRQKARAETIKGKSKWIAAAVIAGIWLLLIILVVKTVWF
jgi:uncharacterized membrane protein YkvA (DUF1232 family)